MHGALLTPSLTLLKAGAGLVEPRPNTRVQTSCRLLSLCVGFFAGSGPHICNRCESVLVFEVLGLKLSSEPSWRLSTGLSISSDEMPDVPEQKCGYHAQEMLSGGGPSSGKRQR